MPPDAQQAEIDALREEVRNLEEALAAALGVGATNIYPRILTDWRQRVRFITNYYGRDAVLEVVNATDAAPSREGRGG